MGRNIETETRGKPCPGLKRWPHVPAAVSIALATCGLGGDNFQGAARIVLPPGFGIYNLIY
ncbi:hypothetical protein GGTG_09509 [Gaeumannomyces tritici R3-111a-1]|uniref:Uncharacterized protein n=1 Tax=Gaeumannomyces tritici (strain R3-111a-1) TaxID=644352 RepID=J3P7L7_GAET3|nr:hypothetical protein GGTG_09509 [Gaeumannomyces tritici R3-111a-1]EJT72649.1 hypothetical protein GGTG_09509 [Gaeumannomyces tritici R3-111a-1]